MRLKHFCIHAASEGKVLNQEKYEDYMQVSLLIVLDIPQLIIQVAGIHLNL